MAKTNIRAVANELTEELLADKKFESLVAGVRGARRGDGVVVFLEREPTEAELPLLPTERNGVEIYYEVSGAFKPFAP